jgi:predicted DNA repair protein MutK
MPRLLTTLAAVGTAAMLWVGGGILVHGLEELGVHFPGHPIEAMAEWAAHSTGGIGDAVGWLVGATLYAVAGIVTGVIIAMAIGLAAKFRHGRVEAVS